MSEFVGLGVVGDLLRLSGAREQMTRWLEEGRRWEARSFGVRWTIAEIGREVDGIEFDWP